MVVLVVVRSTNQKSSNLNSFIFFSTGLGKLGLGLGWAWLGYQYSTSECRRCSATIGFIRSKYEKITISKFDFTVQ